MRLAATLLLLLMACIFAAATYFRDVHPALPWVKAFAEAAMVGGLADWFAVTALFRHPLGLPIPHTAIIPANKDRIGDSLAVFLRENFLTPGVVTRRLEDVDMAGGVAKWLLAPGQARHPSAPATTSWRPLLARLIEALDHKALGNLVRDAATDKLRAVALSPILADAIDTTLDKGRHEPLIDSALDWGLRTLDDQESTIRGMVADRTTWLLRLVNVDERVSSSLLTGLRKLIWEMGEDPHHPLRRRIGESLRTYAFDLRHFPETQATVEGFKDDLIANPAMGHWLAGLWDSARAGLIRNLNDPAKAQTGRLAETLQALGHKLESDEALRTAINTHLRRAAVGLVDDYGDEIVSLVSDTVRQWDAGTVTDKLETAVGRDLQFIRINGTIIGGLVGLAIHTVTVTL